jgi:hypothetical protein
MGTSTPTPQYMDFVGNPAVKPLQKSQTLMRSAVANHSDDTPAIKTTSLISNTTNAPMISPKLNVTEVDSSRLNRAQSTQKSDMVTHFSAKPLQAAINAPDNATPEPATPQAQPTVTEPATFDQPSMNIFERGIKNATAHEEPPLMPAKKGGSKRLIGALSLSLFVIVALGVFVNLNVKRIDVYLAASKAGFSATLPSNGPSGFDLSKVDAAAGIISTSYKSNSDTRNYTITERQSLWDSSTLLDSYVSGIANTNYQTYQSDGLQIFVYGNKNATWVNNGIWYIVSSNNNSLSNAQLVNIADSM